MKITREAIAAALAENQSVEMETPNAATYYLHVTEDQEIVGSYRKAAASFHADRDITEFNGEDDEDFDSNGLCETETLDNPEFAAVVEDLYQQVVEYFAE